MLNLFNKIDLQRLSGVKAILGIDVTESRVRLVEVERRGNPFNKYGPNFKVRKYISHEFVKGSSLQENVLQIQKLLQANKITTKLAVSSIQSMGVKVVSALVPSDTENIGEWINEHYDKLLKIPISLNQFSYQHEVLNKTESGINIEVTFLRNSEIEEWMSYFKLIGLEIIALSAGLRESFNALLYSEYCTSKIDTQFIHLAENTSLVSLFKKGRRAQTQYLSISAETDLPGQIAYCFSQQDEHSNNIVVAGEITNNILIDNYSVLKPFGLSSEYTLAVGLAVKGFVPEISGINFLKAAEINRSTIRIYRSLAYRLAFALCSFVLILLFIQLVVSYFLQSRIDKIDGELLSSGPAFAEVTSLEHQVHELESTIGEGGVNLQRTNFAKSLHSLALLTPDSVWLNKLTLDDKDDHRVKLSIYGFAKSNESVAEFLKNLRKNRFCSEVNLVRSGSPLQSEPVIPVGNKSHSYVTFEIKAIVADP